MPRTSRRISIRSSMQAATAPTLPHNRVRNWYDELQRILRDLPAMPPNAQRAVRSVMASILEEDEEQQLGASLTIDRDAPSCCSSSSSRIDAITLRTARWAFGGIAGRSRRIRCNSSYQLRTRL